MRTRVDSHGEVRGSKAGELSRIGCDEDLEASHRCLGCLRSDGVGDPRVRVRRSNPRKGEGDGRSFRHTMAEIGQETRGLVARSRVSWAYAFAALAVAAIPVLWLWPFTIDDALISVRYARHLADGVGYRFNPGGPSHRWGHALAVARSCSGPSRAGRLSRFSRARRRSGVSRGSGLPSRGGPPWGARLAHGWRRSLRSSGSPCACRSRPTRRAEWRPPSRLRWRRARRSCTRGRGPPRRSRGSRRACGRRCCRGPLRSP